MDSRAATRAGQAAASIATTTPRTRATATIGHETIDPTSMPPPASADHQTADDDPERDPEDRSGQTQDAGLDDDRAPDLATGHPGRAQDPDLADPFDDVHGQRVDDPERGHEDRDDRQRIEQTEDAAERVVDGARDLVEGHDLERVELGLATERVLGGGRRVRREADREDVGAGDTEMVRGVAPADEHRLAARARDAALDDPDDDEVQWLTVGGGHRDDVSQVEPEPGRETCRDDRRATGVEGGQRGGPIAGREDEPAVGGEVRPDDRGAIDPGTLQRDVERGDGADPGDTRHGRGEVALDPFVRGDRPDGGQDDVAGDDLGDPGTGLGPCVLTDAAEGDDHRQPDGQGAQGQRRATPVADDGSAREALLEADQERERDARDPGDDGQDDGDEQGRDEKDRVDRERLGGRRRRMRCAARRGCR